MRLTDRIESALRKHHQLALRSELHSHYSDLFVDHDQLSLLERPDWQVVFGRRGTGKTLLLGVQRVRSNERLAETRILPVFIAAQDCLVSPVGRSVTDEMRAHAYFQELLRLLGQRVLERVDELLEKPSLLDALLGAHQHRKSEIERLVLEVMYAAERGEPVAAYELTKSVQKDTASTSRRANAGASLKVGTRWDQMGAGVDLGGQLEEQATHTMQEEVERVLCARYSSVRSRLIELLDALNLRSLLIHLDEWSVFDPTAGTAIQPIIADLLKRTFGGTPRFSIKIATNRYQTKFNNRAASTKTRGLELGADIFEATNLDHALVGTVRLASFYEKLLYKRLRFLEPELSVFDGPNPDEPQAGFLEAIFKDRRAFDTLVWGAEAVPRDFVIALNELSKDSQYRIRPRWDVRFIEATLRKKSVLTKQTELEYQSEADQLLSLGVKPIVERNGSRRFLVRTTDLPIIEPAIEELLEKRLIHEVSVELLPSHVRSDYKGFLLDYGLWLDWEPKVARRAGSDPEAFQRALDETPEKIVVDTRAIRPDSVVECPHCGARFPVEARPYVLRKLCALCYLPVGKDEGT